MARLSAVFASLILVLTATCAHAQAIACGFEQMDETQRQIAGEAFTTTDLLPRRAANAVISDAIAAGTLAIVGANYSLSVGRADPDIVVGTLLSER